MSGIGSTRRDVLPMLSLMATRKSTVRTGIAAMAAATALCAPTAAHAVSQPNDATYTTACPPAESLVSGTSWSSQQVVRGVTLREATRDDDFGMVRLHVLRVALATASLSVRPLVTTLARRSNLSLLARHRRGLVAAVNAGYFDFTYGAPTVPLVSGGKALLDSTAPAPVVGISTKRVAQAGPIALRAAVTVGTSRRALSAVNVIDAPPGVTVYTTRWGSARIPLPSDSISRKVVSGAVASAVGTYATVPSGGSLLVARGRGAQTWLRSLALHRPVTYTNTVAATGVAAPYQVAFGVGAQIVTSGRANTGMSCRVSDPMPARTAIGFARGGATLILVEAEDDPGGLVHGLDNDQMARVMHDVGAYQAYELDGSGSTEMLARVPQASNSVCQRTNVSGLSCRTYPADGEERPMPVGIGIYAG
jgi:hypothetical protein